MNAPNYTLGNGLAPNWPRYAVYLNTTPSEWKTEEERIDGSDFTDRAQADPQTLERRLIQQAVQQSLGQTAYLSTQIATMPKEERPFYETATPEEWSREFIAWAESHRNLPPLPPQSYDRAYFYEDCR